MANPLSQEVTQLRSRPRQADSRVLPLNYYAHWDPRKMSFFMWTRIPPAHCCSNRGASLGRPAHTTVFLYPRASPPRRHFKVSFSFAPHDLVKASVYNEDAFAERNVTSNASGVGSGHSSRLDLKHSLWTPSPVLLLLKHQHAPPCPLPPTGGPVS